MRIKNSGITFLLVGTIALSVTADASKKKKTTINDMMENINSSSRGGDLSIKKKNFVIPEANTNGRNSFPSGASLAQVKPPQSGEIFKDSGTDEDKLEAITDQQINELYHLTQKYGKGKNRGQLWLRLAEAYVEKAKYIELRVQKEYDDKFALYEAKKGSKPKLNLNGSYEYNVKAIKLYEWFLRDFPKDERAEQALFFLGYNHVEMGQLQKGIAYYKKLTEKYPNSAYVSEANFALGDYYFDNNKMKEAYHYYAEVLKNRRARLYTFGLYKLAWCQFRMERAGDAIKSLEEVIHVSRAGMQNSDSPEGRKAVSRIRLGSEALKDLVLFYSEGGDYRSASEYFLRIGGETVQYPMLEKLAYVYSDQGKKEDARYVFRQLLDRNPKAPKAFDYQYQIVQNFSTLKNQPAYRQELYTWIDNYGPGSDWAEANKDNKKLIEDSSTLRETSMRNYTLTLHKNYQNSAKKPDASSAKDAYRLYLSKFGDSTHGTEMHFFYGELLYSLNDFNEAGKEYRVVAEREPKGKYYEQAVLNTLLSLEKNLKTDDQIKVAVGSNLNPVAFGESETSFIAAAEKYILEFPRGNKVVDVKFKIGRLHYGYNHFDDSIKIFRQIIAMHPRTPYAVYSANLILDIHNLRKDYDNLSREGLAYMRNKDLTQQGFQTDVRNLVESASFKKAQDLEGTKNYEASAKAFGDFSRNYPQSALSASASYNSGINYERAGNLPSAIAMYQKVQVAPNKNNEKLKQKSMLLLGRLYEQTSQFDKAAVLFERYAKENPSDKVSPDLYFNAAVIWEGQKEFYKSISDYEKYYETSHRKERTQVLYTIAKIHEKAGHLKAAEDNYQKFINSGDSDADKIVESYFRLAEISQRRGKHADAEKEFARTVSVQRNFASRGKNVGAAWAAESKFNLTQQTYNDLVNLRIPANPKKQGEAVKQKLGLLTKLSNELSDVIKYDDGNMIIASLTTLGKAYDHMGMTIYNSPLPKDLNAQEMEAYKKGVDGLARPLMEKAIENYTLAINKSYQINFYSQWTKTALDAMAKKQPDKFGEPKELVLPILRTDDMGML